MADYTVFISQTAALPNAAFTVTVSNGETTTHEVTLSRDYYDSLVSDDTSAETLVRRAFDFLLQREPNTAILSQFDLRDIERYFPDFPAHIAAE